MTSRCVVRARGSAGAAGFRRAVAVVGLMACVLPAHAAAPAWKPQKNIEIVVATSPGSGLDTMARTLGAILREQGLVASSVSVVNKPGGAMAVGLGYLAQHAGDGHMLFMNTASVLAAHITGQSRFDYTDFTPLAQLATEPLVVVGPAQSAFGTGRDLVAQLKKAANSVSFAFSTTRGNTAHMAIALAGQSAGIDIRRMKTVVFNSAGDATAAALGNHVDVAVGTPANLVPLMQAGKIRMLAVTATERAGGALQEVPTWREQGIDAVMTQWRGVLGTKGLSAQQVAFWDATLRALTATADWKRYLDKHQFPDAYTDSEHTRQALEAEYDATRRILTELGLAKQPEGTNR